MSTLITGEVVPATENITLYATKANESITLSGETLSGTLTLVNFSDVSIYNCDYDALHVIAGSTQTESTTDVSSEAYNLVIESSRITNVNYSGYGTDKVIRPSHNLDIVDTCVSGMCNLMFAGGNNLTANMIRIEEGVFRDLYIIGDTHTPVRMIELLSTHSNYLKFNHIPVDVLHVDDSSLVDVENLSDIKSVVVKGSSIYMKQ